MAERMGVDRAYISGLELVQRNPTVTTLWHTAQALDVEVHQLLKEQSSLPFEVRRKAGSSLSFGRIRKSMMT